MKHTLAVAGLVAGLAAGLVAGGAAGLVLVPASALGQPTARPTATAEHERKAPGEHLRAVLAPLVAKGTITQAQADAVIKALQDARPPAGSGRHHGFHIDTVAETLGITEAQLHTAVRSGRSIADVARSKGIAPQKVIDALVAEAKTRLTKEVADGELTQAQADARLTQMTGRITSLVNSGRPGKTGRGHVEPADVPAPAEGDVERADSPA